MHITLDSGPIVDRVRASVTEMPLRDRTFDAALSTQVLEHLPSAQLREAFVTELARVLKPGGRLVLTAYNWNAGRRAKGIPKEGFHKSGIFYHCFDRQELEQALASQFIIRRMWSVGVLLPFTYRLTRRLGRRIVYWDRLWRAQRSAMPYAEVLLVQCERSADATRWPDVAGGHALCSGRSEGPKARASLADPAPRNAVGRMGLAIQAPGGSSFRTVGHL
jgi:SAM-dependent methyltransferase